jgi:hypothetical protein
VGVQVLNNGKYEDDCLYVTCSIRNIKFLNNYCYWLLFSLFLHTLYKLNKYFFVLIVLICMERMVYTTNISAEILQTCKETGLKVNTDETKCMYVCMCIYIYIHIYI